MLYFARRPFQYGPDPVKNFLDPYQVTELRGEGNDEPLTRLGYLASIPGTATVTSCGLCGKKFITDAGLNAHGTKWHKGAREPEIKDAKSISESRLAQEVAVTSPMHIDEANAINASEDARVRMSESRLDKELPLNWDKTKASIAAGEDVITVNSQVPGSSIEKRKPGRPRKTEVSHA